MILCSYVRPLAARADDLDRPSQAEGSLSHGLKPEVSRKLGAGVEARAVVPNLDDQRLARRRETKFDMARPCVLGRVVEGFLGDPQQSLLDDDRGFRLGVSELIHCDAVPRAQDGRLLGQRADKTLPLERLPT